MDYTPESIEAIPHVDILQIKELAASLHEATPALLDTPLPAQEIERQEQLRGALCLKISRTLAYLDGEIANLSALKTDLRIVKSYATSDKKRLESYKIAGFVREKEERNKYTPQQ